ncbi:cold-shock protein [Paenibacillus sp. NPDC056579]|uniref:cold-shock protein n=1 Tax=Paenibacillus sp. NPDC056579 TaxID=3345871 RepID=UPI003686F098
MYLPGILPKDAHKPQGGVTLYFSKKTVEPVQEEQTAVWMCSKEGCSCWMRENFALEELPSCPLCQSEMVKNTKMLPTLFNHHKPY